MKKVRRPENAERQQKRGVRPSSQRRGRDTEQFQRITKLSAWRRAGREPLRRVRSFGSAASQAMKKVRRPENVESRQKRGVRRDLCDRGAISGYGCTG